MAVFNVFRNASSSGAATVVTFPAIFSTCPGEIDVLVRPFKAMMFLYRAPSPRNFSAIFQSVSPEVTV